MSKRNIILFTIVLVIIALLIVGFLYFRGQKEEPGDTDGINFLADFNPFRRKPPATPTPGVPTDISETPVSPGEQVVIKLKKVSGMPIAGFGVFQKERFVEVPEITPWGTSEPGETTSTPTVPTAPTTEFAPALRYVARANGNIYQTFADKIDERRFTDTVIPKVYEAYFGKNGESVVMRYLKADGRTIASFAGSIPKENLGEDFSGGKQVTGTFLPDGVSDMSVSPDGSKIFYLFESGNGAAGITSGVLGDQKIQVFDSPFTEWLSLWPNAKMITLTTKPSAGVPGYMYAINTDKKDLTKILGDINGLTTLTSPDGKLVLWGNNNLALGIYDISTRSSASLNARTLPEKCVWSKTSDVIYCSVPRLVSPAPYPDAWYRGEVSFFDEIWKIDIKNSTSAIISNMVSVSGPEEIDGIKLTLDVGEDYLFFVNKRDSYLWELFLK